MAKKVAQFSGEIFVKNAKFGNFCNFYGQHFKSNKNAHRVLTHFWLGWRKFSEISILALLKQIIRFIITFLKLLVPTILDAWYLVATVLSAVAKTRRPQLTVPTKRDVVC